MMSNLCQRQRFFICCSYEVKGLTDPGYEEVFEINRSFRGIRLGFFGRANFSGGKMVL